eukprot:g5311.t1
MAGKWHLGPGQQIPNHGFDKVFYKNSARPATANIDLKGNDVPLGRQEGDRYHLDACSDVTCAFISRFQKQPFFFYLAYRAPHVPLDPPKKYLDRFPGKMPERRRKALAMISAMDDGVGRILAALRKHKLEENTLIFFISDNGAPLKIHKYDAPGGGPGWDGSLNDPLNGEKGMLSEGGIRVPFVVSWKGKLPAGKVYDHPVISLDVAATAVALAGQKHDAQLDGVNLIPYLTGEKQGAPHETLYWRWVGQAAVREGKWKLLQGGERRYLYNLDDDPGEKRNLLQQHPDIAQRLHAKLSRWAGELKPAGLNARLSSAVNSYFDFYLDGKPAPPLRKNSRKSPKKARNRAAIFKRRDTNGDGRLTLKELIGNPQGRNVKALTRHRLLKYSARGSELKTTTRMAFWLQPGQKSNSRPAKNRTRLSNHIVSKHVRIGVKGLPQVLQYDVTFTVPKGEPHTYAQFEALTGYMPAEFSRFQTYDPATGRLRGLSDGPGEQKDPVVLSTADGRHAMGIFSPQQPARGYPNAGYGRFRFTAQKVVKWNCVFRVRDANGIKPGDYRYRMYVAVGTREDVRKALQTLHARRPRRSSKR